MKEGEHTHLHPCQQRLLHRFVDRLHEGFPQLRCGGQEIRGGKVHERLSVGGREAVGEKKLGRYPAALLEVVFGAVTLQVCTEKGPSVCAVSAGTSYE